MANPRGRICLLAIGMVLLLMAGVLIQRQSVPPEMIGSVASQTSAPEPSDRAENRIPVSQVRADRSSLPDLPAPVESPYPPESPDSRAWIDNRVTEIEDLAWFDDSGSLGEILTELRNPLPEIRAAALEAVRDFGSRDAIPYLEAISKNSIDPMELTAIRDLIEFLNRPTLLEISDRNGIE